MSKDKIIGPTLPPGLVLDDDHDDVPPSSSKDDESSDEDFGPALPPGFKSSNTSTYIGPYIPKEFMDKINATKDDNDDDEDDDDDDDDNKEVYGLIRADEISKTQYDPSPKESTEENKREEWMLKPSKGVKQKLPTKSVTKFSQKSSSRKPDPLTKEQQLELKVVAKKEEKIKEFLDKYEKHNKRNVSLLDEHRKHAKNKKPKVETVERREFDREKDLKVPRMDNKLKRTFLRDASSTFGTRFSSGRFGKFL